MVTDHGLFWPSMPAAQREHRPWPVPERPWSVAMVWHDLAFLHWPVDAAAVQRLLPEDVTLDRYDGAAWLGVVPFRMTGVRWRMLPWPALAFAELNVRTYVTVGGKPGVWFFSLDAASRLAVRGARWTYRLPYFDAAMSCERDGEAVRYASTRTHRGAAAAVLRCRYAPSGPVAQARPGSLEAFLTDRYCLYVSGRGGRLRRGDIAHAPWPLQPATVAIEEDSMSAWLGIVREGAPVVHFARRLEVVAWSAEPV